MGLTTLTSKNKNIPKYLTLQAEISKVFLEQFVSFFVDTF
jgi:hypothetical protein